jgi:hypothetical protein
MARWKGTTTQRGYGNTHAAERKRRLAAHHPGDPCTIGGEPLYDPPEMLDLAHDHVNGGYLPGLACRYHNRQEGASRSNQARGFRPASAGGDVRCKACGQPYHYAARNCEMCGAHYHPTYGQQRTCGRACGIVLQQHNRAAKPPAPKPRPKPKPPQPSKLRPTRKPWTPLGLLDDPIALRIATHNWRTERRW